VDHTPSGSNADKRFSRSEIYRRAGWPEGTPGRLVLLKCGKSTLVDMGSLRAAVAALQGDNPRQTERVKRGRPDAISANGATGRYSIG
jgi:hypothetical protein